MSVGVILGEISSDKGARPQPPIDVHNAEAIDTKNKALLIAARQPAAVESTKLADLLIQERRADDVLRTSGAQVRQDVDEVLVDNDGTLASTRHIIDQLKTQFEAHSEVAVLAQANQLPNPALSFSESTTA